ncbi:MAG: hypothetical protein IKI20_09580 [Lachnospiraceae bacterium]|nr:hypothetical protein [Lachnospiraceae bacterium]
MPDLLNNFTFEDVNNANNIAGTALFTILKDDVPEDKKKEILKSIHALYSVELQPEKARVYMDGRNEDFIEASQNFALYSDSQRPKNKWVTGNSFKVYTNPAAKEPLERFANSMKELSGYLTEKLRKDDFKSLEERDLAYMFKGMTEKLGNGESLSELSDRYPQFSYATNMFIKLNLTGAEVNANTDTNEVTIGPSLPNNDNQMVFQNLGGTGIMQAIAGAYKVTDLQERYEKNGDITINELIDEYDKQEARMNTVLNISENDFNRIDGGDQKTFGNGYDEITGGKRGYQWVRDDAEFASTLLSKGFPVGDLPALRHTYRAMNELSRFATDTQKSIDEVKKVIEDEERKENRDQNLIRQKKDEMNALMEKKGKYESAYNLLKPRFDAYFEDDVDSLDKRNLILNELREATQTIVNNYMVGEDDSAKAANYLLNQRLNTPLKAYEKARVSANAQELYEALDSVDPARVKSSDEFSEIKKKLNLLRKLEDKILKAGADEYEDKMDDFQEDYQRLTKEVAEAAVKYLRYKDKQLKNPTKRHKRTKLEADRVRVVDALLDRCNRLTIPRIDVSAIYDKVEGLRYVPSSNTIATEEKNVGGKNLDTYIKLHTGSIGINGTVEEMRENFKKVLAAMELKKKNPTQALDVKKIHAIAAEMKYRYPVNTLSENTLKNALIDEKHMKDCCRRIDHKRFTVKDMNEPGAERGKEGKHNRFHYFINHFIAIYCYMKEPQVKSDEYKKLFQTIRTLAHLDSDLPEKMDEQLLSDRVAELNKKAMDQAEDLLNNPKCTIDEARFAVYALGSFYSYLPEDGAQYAANIMSDFNKRNGLRANSLNYMDIDKLHGGKIIDLVNKDKRQPLRKLQKKYREDTDLLMKRNIDNYTNKKESRVLESKKKDYNLKLKNGNKKKESKEAPELKSKFSL